MDLKQADLDQFTGSEYWYRHSLNPSVTYTDGARYLAEHGGAYWFLDEIALANRYRKDIRDQEFQVWKLLLTPNDPRHAAILQCEDGDDHVVFTKLIEFTDFPLDSVELFFENNVIYLPSER